MQDWAIDHVAIFFFYRYDIQKPGSHRQGIYILDDETVHLSCTEQAYFYDHPNQIMDKQMYVFHKQWNQT